MLTCRYGTPYSKMRALLCLYAISNQTRVYLILTSEGRIRPRHAVFVELRLRGLGNAVLAVFGTFLVIYRSEFEDSSLNTV